MTKVLNDTRTNFEQTISKKALPCMMMMISFITINSGLVPLMDSECVYDMGVCVRESVGWCVSVFECVYDMGVCVRESVGWCVSVSECVYDMGVCVRKSVGWCVTAFEGVYMIWACVRVHIEIHVYI